MASSTSASSSRQLNLKLSELGWTEVSSKIADWSQVASIDLSFNPLQCDCEMTWLKDVLSGIDAANQNDTDSPKSQVICQLPLSLEGKSLLVSVIFALIMKFLKKASLELKSPGWKVTAGKGNS